MPEHKKVAKMVLLADEALTGINLEDRISIPTQRTLTDAGQMHVPCKFARTGAQLYTAKQLGMADEADNKVITVYRDEADVFDEASVESFRSAPVTLGHPLADDGSKISVSAENAKDLQVGMLEGMPVRDEDTLGGILILSAQEAIDALEEGTKELSAGYTCDIEMVDGKFFQRNIKANHIAIVSKGRAGSSCRISDEAGLVIEDAYEALTVELADAKAAATESATKAEALQTTLDDAKLAHENIEVELEKAKLELADAVVAASEGVVERCSAIENARLIADMRDLADKSVSEIHKLVVTDQMPEKDFEGKSPDFMAAMFEILVDASKGETPMGKLITQADQAQVVVDEKPVDPVLASRQKMIERNKTK